MFLFITYRFINIIIIITFHIHQQNYIKNKIFFAYHSILSINLVIQKWIKFLISWTDISLDHYKIIIGGKKKKWRRYYFNLLAAVRFDSKDSCGWLLRQWYDNVQSKSVAARINNAIESESNIENLKIYYKLTKFKSIFRKKSLVIKYLYTNT